MVRISFGEQEENEMKSRANNKRKSRSPIERENHNKSRKSTENQEEMSGRTENHNGRISVTIDPDVLDCFVCCEPLRRPLYQCENGHVTCPVCGTKLPQNKCPACSQPINLSRCLCLEKIIESIKFPCCYSIHGCNKTLTNLEISSHQERCIHAPCFCPMPRCFFSGSPEQVSAHFIAHQYTVGGFEYGEQYSISVEDEPFYALPINNGPLFLLVNDSHDKGNALWVACIRPSSTESDFRYELTVSDGENSLQLKTSAINARRWERVYPSTNFLLVPTNFSSTPGNAIDVCIKIGRVHSI